MATSPFLIFRQRVVIIQKTILQYRVQLFGLLKERLNAAGIELTIVYGEPEAVEALKGDVVDLDWGIKIRNFNFKLGHSTFTLQPCTHIIANADLVIVEQASRLLINYLFFFQHFVGRRRLAFWGHGKNMRSHQASKVGEILKRFISRRVHWWFAYNDFSAEIVKELGFPANRITSVQNSIDMKQLKRLRASLTTDHINQIKQDLGLKGNNIGMFIGGMYSAKRIKFLIEACKIIRSHASDFEMIFVGAGPELPYVEKASLKHNWIYSVGPKFDANKVPYFAISKLILLPSSIGLAVLDSFALGVPIITIDAPYHGPEISYLINGSNGVKLREDTNPDEYAKAAVSLLTDEVARYRLVEGCNQASNFYGIETMVERFANGIESALLADT